jgi:pimeloyl-ACP methyl ester carboxylesterase
VKSLASAGLALLLVALVLLLAANVAAWRMQERIVFQPTPPPFPSDAGWPRTVYAAADGQPLFAYVVGDRARATGAVIAFHGNADLAVNQIWWAEALARRTGILVVVPEYRGYGGLGGTPSYEGSRRDARAAYALVRDTLGVPPERVTLYGHSLGTAIATDLAADVAPRALVLVSPFTSVRAMGGYLLTPRVPPLWRLIARLHWDTEARVARLDAPVWVAHGSLDRVIPARMGAAVHAAARVKGELLLVPGAGHNDVHGAAAGPYQRWLDAARGAAGAAAPAVSR